MTVLIAKCAWDEGKINPVGNGYPQGLSFEKKEYKHNGETHFYNENIRHEYAPARYFKKMPEKLIVNINGTNYHLKIQIDNYREHPSKIIVSFIKTDYPESEFEKWDESAYLVSRRSSAVKDLEEYNKLNEKEPNMGWDTFITWREQEIKKIDDGEVSYMPPFDIQIFGKPQFIQNEVFPEYNGVLAYSLATINTGWGDSGNVNIFFACDDSGKPCVVWYEASCC